MADQGIPDFGFGTCSQVGTVEDILHVQSPPTDEFTEGEIANVGVVRASGVRTSQTVTPTSHDAGTSTPAPSDVSALLGLPEGETLASWYAKNQATLNLV
ncbi:hypothetical protein Hanom_Chr06g00536111 [Helianthus anomalus]